MTKMAAVVTVADPALVLMKPEAIAEGITSSPGSGQLGDQGNEGTRDRVAEISHVEANFCRRRASQRAKLEALSFCAVMSRGNL